MDQAREAAVGIASRLREAGHEALFAGGCVRDRLRGVPPHDYDLATSARPDEVQALFPETVAVGAAFGVILVRVDGRSYEVATFREDLGIADGRHPAAVRYADARADAARRDFTVNGMFEDPATGAILDFVGGRADLAARVVRAIGDPARRYREDRLRMLRAVRFATILDFTLEEGTAGAIRAGAQTIGTVSAERVREELVKILRSGRGGRGIGLLRETGLLESLLPEVAALDGVPQPSLFHPEGDVLTHTRLLLDGWEGGDEALAWAALLHDVGKAPTFGINEKGRYAFPNHAGVGADLAVARLERLRVPRRTIEATRALIERHMDWPALPRMRPAKQRRFLLRDDFAGHLELHRLDCEACHRDLSIHAYATRERARLDAEPPPVRPLLDGHDLQALGYRPGPGMGRVLEALVDAQLEGGVTDAAEARRFVTTRFAPPDGREVAEEGPA